jgi:hypothetical protein
MVEEGGIKIKKKINFFHENGNFFYLFYSKSPLLDVGGFAKQGINKCLPRDVENFLVYGLPLSASSQDSRMCSQIILYTGSIRVCPNSGIERPVQGFMQWGTGGFILA